MKTPAELNNELAAELSEIKAGADAVQAALAAVADSLKGIPGAIAAIVQRAEDWDQDYRVHGEKIKVADPAGGTVVDLSQDQVFVGLGGGSITSGGMYINEAHGLPGMANFRPATELEVRHIKNRFGEGRVDDVMKAGGQIGK